MKVYGHVDKSAINGIEINAAIGRDSNYPDVYRMCLENEPGCEKPRNAKTTLYLLEHGLYDGNPASKVILVPHTGDSYLMEIATHQCIGTQNI